MLTKFHPFYLMFEKIIKQAIKLEPVYDLGTSSRFAKELGLVRHLFIDEGKYFAGGYKPNFELGLDSCDFHCDLESLENIDTGSIGSVLCLSVLEHVFDPSKALAEIFRVLKSNGTVVASIPFFAGYHGKNQSFDVLRVDSSHENYSDFWRFTHEGLRVLFIKAGFEDIQIYPVDGPLICRLEILGVYRYLSRLRFVDFFIKKLDKPKLGKITTIHFVVAKKR